MDVDDDSTEVEILDDNSCSSVTSKERMESFDTDGTLDKNFDVKPELQTPHTFNRSNNVSKKSTGSIQRVIKDEVDVIPSIISETDSIIYKPRLNTVRLLQELKFMEDFDPKNSTRNQQKKKKRYHHVDGRLTQYADDFEECDCLHPNCKGCHFPCRTCQDTRCGQDCRVNRKWIYESVEVEGRNVEYKNTHNISTF